MPAEEGGHDVDRVEPRGGDDLEALHLVLEREPVARFGLDRRRPQSEEALQAFEEPGQQRRLWRAAHAAHAREDAAASLVDLEVRRAPRAHLELVLPRAEEHGVRVRVDEARDDRALARVELGRRMKARPQVRFRTDGDDRVVLHGDRGLRENLDLPHARPAARNGAAAGRDLARIPDEQVDRFVRSGRFE